MHTSRCAECFRKVETGCGCVKKLETQLDELRLMNRSRKMETKFEHMDVIIEASLGELFTYVSNTFALAKRLASIKVNRVGAHGITTLLIIPHLLHSASFYAVILNATIRYHLQLKDTQIQ